MVYSYYQDNNWAADPGDMQLISNVNEKARLLLCVIDIQRKFTWVIPLKDKKGITIIETFQKNLEDSDHKSNKTWINQGTEISNR